ncbi:MAG: NADH-quinone oxidoreductase subunit J [Ignavibacteria bacterium]|nr:NADH-quinone oxidoreductase subunit J [Ignavibacteria bacterium]
MTFETILFYVLALAGIVSALLVITRRNPMHAALFLIVNFVALAGIYLTLHAQFVAITQVLVYAGAIMVLVLFVIMLLNLQNEQDLFEKRSWRSYSGPILSLLLLALLLRTVAFVSGGSFDRISPESERIGTVANIGQQLFTAFVFPFEMASLLLLAAMVGAVILAKKRFP